MKVWSISSEKGRIPHQIAYIPRISTMSIIKAVIAPTEKARLRKRTKMYAKMAMKAKITLQKAPRVISSATEGPTFWLLMIEPPARSSRLMKLSNVRSPAKRLPAFRVS